MMQRKLLYYHWIWIETDISETLIYTSSSLKRLQQTVKKSVKLSLEQYDIRTDVRL